jgi:DNA polymerase-3 subunit gamma/tau
MPAPSPPVAASPVPEQELRPVATAGPDPAAASTLVAREPGPRGDWDWLAVVAGLRLGGMAKMLADHCELISQANDAVVLRVGEAHKHLLDLAYREKLMAALRDKYGPALDVRFEVGAAAEQTPQQVRTRIREARQRDAVAAIESDPFVRELVEQFGGQIDASSIQPTGEPT